MAKIHGVLIKDGALTVADLEDELEVYCKELDCALIDITQRRIGGVIYDVVCDDEGLYHTEKPISMLNIQDMTPMLIGSLFITRSDKDGMLQSLDDQDVKNIMAHFRFRVVLGDYV